MSFHISLIACAHGTGDMARIREKLAARAIEIWVASGVVAVAPLVDAGKCDLLTTWQDVHSFQAWQQRISQRTLLAFPSRLGDGPQLCFDCALQEADLARRRQPRPSHHARRLVPWRRPAGH